MMFALGGIARYRARATQMYYGGNGRPAPFNVAILSLPGCGKTTLTMVAHAAVASAIGMKYDPDAVATLNADFDFFDTYDSSRHLFVTLDEFGSTNPDFTTSTKHLSNLTKLTGEASF